jgi:type IX secretion system substrate protein/Kelch motif protein
MMKITTLYGKKCGRAWLLISALFTFFSTGSFAKGTWKKVSNASPSYNYGVMLLLSDGTVMCKNAAVGSSGSGWDKLTPDASGSYVNGTWSVLMPMNYTRLYFSTQILMDGRVYVAGGEYGTGKATCEIYDPVNDAWTPGPKLPAGDSIVDGNSEILPDGKVLQGLVEGGGPFGSGILIYDPVTNSYTPGPSSRGSHDESAWVKLKDNSILFVDFSGKTSERYIPSLNAWVKDADVPVYLYDTVIGETGPALLLPDGRAFFMGSPSVTAYYTPSGDATPGSWIVGPKVPNHFGAPDAAASMMVNGKILYALSDTSTFKDEFPSPTYFYEFDYLADSFTEVKGPLGIDTISSPSFNSHMLNLPDGSILFSDAGASYYIYFPDSTPLPAGKPVISQVLKVNCDTFIATGSLFNGISEGSAYGDDWQMASNYPLVRLTAGANVYYARTYNWNSTGVMRGTAADTTYFSLPAGLPEGTYALQVTVNGNPSDSFSFSTCGITGTEMVSQKLTNMYVYPNPAKNQVTVGFGAVHAGRYSIKVLNVLGQAVIEETGNAVVGDNVCHMTLYGIAKGIYTISIQDGTGVRNTKLVVE